MTIDPDIRERQRLRRELMMLHLMDTLLPGERAQWAEIEADALEGSTPLDPASFLADMRMQPHALVCPEEVRDHVADCGFCKQSFLDECADRGEPEARAILEYRRLGAPGDRLEMRHQTRQMYERIADIMRVR